MESTYKPVVKIKDQLTRKLVFQAIEKDLRKDNLPDGFFDYLWDLADRVSDPDPEVNDRLNEHVYLFRHVLDALALVSSRHKLLEEKFRKYYARWETAARAELGGRPTIDQIRAWIYETFGEAPLLQQDITALDALKDYLLGLRQLCLDRKETVRELSTNIRKGYMDEQQSL